MKKVTAAIRKYDPNHLYLGCRFNQESEELQNSEMFKVAGQYMDIISITIIANGNRYKALWLTGRTGR